MNTSPSYSNVTGEGYVSFLSDLRQSPWAEIPAPAPAQPLSEAPAIVGWKDRLLRAVDGVLAAMGFFGTLQEAVKEWKRCQSQLVAQVMLDEVHRDARRRDAAGRVRLSLLSGSGLAQKLLDADQQLDFGQSQVLQCGKKTTLYADIQLLGYQPLIDEIDRANAVLSVAVGRKVLGPRPLRRSLQIRKALASAARDFKAVTENIEYFSNLTAEGTAAHAHLKNLRLSLLGLAERYPVRTTPEADEQPISESPPAAAPPLPVAPAAPGLGGSPFLDEEELDRDSKA